MRAVGAPFALGIGAHSLLARLRQHVVLPQPPKYAQLRFRVHPPNPPSKGLSCSLLPFAVLVKMGASQQTTAEMDWCRCSRPVPAARREARVSNKNPINPKPDTRNPNKRLAPHTLSGLDVASFPAGSAHGSLEFASLGPESTPRPPETT